jgi:hypothetical protein
MWLVSICFIEITFKFVFRKKPYLQKCCTSFNDIAWRTELWNVNLGHEVRPQPTVSYLEHALQVTVDKFWSIKTPIQREQYIRVPMPVIASYSFRNKASFLKLTFCWSLIKNTKWSVTCVWNATEKCGCNTFVRREALEASNASSFSVPLLLKNVSFCSTQLLSCVKFQVK